MNKKTLDITIAFLSIGATGMLWLFGAPPLLVALPTTGLLYLLLREPTAGFFWLCFLAPFSAVFEPFSKGAVSPFLLLGVISLVSASLKRQKSSVPKWYITLFWTFFLTISIALIATIYSENGAISLGITSYAHLFLGLSIVWILDSDQKIDSLLWAFILGSAIASVLSVLLYYLPQLGELAGIEPFDLRKNRFNGLGRNPNAMSSFYVLSVPFSFWGLLTSSGFRRAAAMIGFGAGILVVIFSQSRSAFSGIILGIGFAYLLIPPNLLSLKARRKMRFLLILFPIGLSVLLLQTGQDKLIEDRVQQEALSAGAAGRKHAITATLKLTLNNPLGVGYSQIQERIDEYGETSVKTPHNSMIAIAAESGWFGIIGALVLVFFPLYYGARCIRSCRSSAQALIASACFASMLGFWIHSSLHVVHHFAAFWIAMGVAVSVWSRIERKHGTSK